MTDPTAVARAVRALEENRVLQAQVKEMLARIDDCLVEVGRRVYIATYASLPEVRADTGVLLNNEPPTVLINPGTIPKPLVSRFRRCSGAAFFIDYDRRVAPVVRRSKESTILLPTGNSKPAWTSAESEVP
jgi:hypothetical protein